VTSNAGRAQRNPDFQPIFCFNLETIEERAIVTVEHLQELVRKLSNGAKCDDLA